MSAVFAPLNTRLAAAELGYMVEDSDSAVLFHGAAVKEAVRFVLIEVARRARESHEKVAAELAGRRPGLSLVELSHIGEHGYEELIARRRFRRRTTIRGGEPRERRDHHVHLGHHRTTQGCSAHPRSVIGVADSVSPRLRSGPEAAP
jgi:hypothetical protein